MYGTAYIQIVKQLIENNCIIIFPREFRKPTTQKLDNLYSEYSGAIECIPAFTVEQEEYHNSVLFCFMFRKGGIVHIEAFKSFASMPLNRMRYTQIPSLKGSGWPSP